ncbi:MAG: wax ester/triacylglycerol synthase family O-acyltransferase [Thermoleophilaceae bacterium]
MDDRLSSLDASFLEVETPAAHMHVGWAALFGPSEVGPRPGFDQLREHIGTRMARAPRYRQRLAEIPLGAADPVWVDDENFAIERHVHRSGSSDLSEVVDEVMSSRLRRDRPMWEMWIADRLGDGRIGVVGKAHHAMVDGLAAVELATLLLDPTPEPPPPEADGWSPAPPPGEFALFAGGLASRASRVLDLATLPLRAVRHPQQVLRVPSLALEASLALADAARPGAGLPPFVRPTSPLRHLAMARRPLAELRETKAALGVSVNDVLLAAVAGGIRSFLRETGTDPVRLKTMVPVSLRSAAEANGLGNSISFVFVDLPCDEPDPLRRVREVARAMGVRKEVKEPEGADVLMRLAGYTPRTLQRVVSRLVSSPRSFDIVVSNIPGPPEPLWMLGCPLEEAYPIVPFADSHSLSVGLTTVCDEAFLGLYVDRRALPGADRLAELVDAEFDELMAAAQLAAPTPV